MADSSHIVGKLGGSSLADGPRFLNTAAIIKADTGRRCVVVSAPGRRFAGDTKVTNALESSCKASSQIERDTILRGVKERYAQIVSDTKIILDIGSLFRQMLSDPGAQTSDQNLRLHYMGSRGEWLQGQVAAKVYDFDFFDAADLIRFAHGKFDMEATRRRAKHLHLEERVRRGVVIPGYYGRVGNDGPIWTFPHGGSDTTGAVVAALTGASLYENWTDVPGVLQTNPKIVPEAQPIPHMTYLELRELAYTGAEVFHPDAAKFVLDAGIPTRIRSTKEPEKPGTLVEADRQVEPGSITGIAGEDKFTGVWIRKYGLNDQLGSYLRFLKIFYDLKMHIEHPTDGIDSMSVLVHSEAFQKNRETVEERIHTLFKPDKVEISDVAVICVVGLGMRDFPGMWARVATTVANARVSIRGNSQDPSESNIIFWVRKSDYATAVRALWEEFFNKK